MKRRNHTVTRAYLLRFADADDLLTMVTLPGDIRIPVSARDATVRKNFYVVRLDDGSESDEAEDLFGEIEGRAVEAIRTLVDQRAWPIPSGARSALADWVALQYLRAPWVRQFTRELAEGMSEVGIPVMDSGGEAVMLRMPTEDVDRLSGSGLHLEFIRRQVAQVAEMLYERSWVLTFYQRKSLATSDTPVILSPDPGRPAGVGIPIAIAGEIHVPLDRRVALSMGSLRFRDRRDAGVTKFALYLNSATASNARRYIFHHPDDDPLHGLTLPEPRLRELASSQAAAVIVRDALA